MTIQLEKLVRRIESSNVSFHGLLAAFGCIVLLRNFLETFSDRDNFWTPVSSFANFVHYPLFYICLIVALSIILYCLTKERIEKITKILILFFPLVLSAPILDIFLSGGKGFNMSYLFGDSFYLLRKFITFSWGYSGKGATPGIQIELMAAFVLIASYIIIKTKKSLRALIGVFAFYVIVFILGSTPSLVAILWNLKDPVITSPKLFSSEVLLYHFYTFNNKIALVLFPFLLGELVLWLWFYEKSIFLGFVRNLRGLRTLHYLGMLGVGMALGYARIRPLDLFDSPFPFLIILAASCSVILAWWYAAGLNDLYDIETDKITNPTRPIVSGVVNIGEQRAFNLVVLILSLIAAYIIRYPFFITILLCLGLSYMYSASPFRLKRSLFFASLILALCAALVCLGGFVLFSDDYSFYGFPPRILIAIIVSFTLAAGVKDIKDIKGDRLAGITTIPILFGEKKGKMVIGFLASLAYLGIPFILRTFTLLPFAVVFAIPTYFLINRKRMRETPIFLLYFFFLGVILIHVFPQIEGR